MRWQAVTVGKTQDEPRHFFRRSKQRWPLIAPHNPTWTILDLHNDEAVPFNRVGEALRRSVRHAIPKEMIALVTQ
jgi:hypothetical protein